MINDKIDKIITKSGNDFHFKVVNKLRSSGWEVVVSPYYVDGMTNKAREVDIIAEKIVQGTNSRQSNCRVKVRLFIECKYINKETLFWFDDINIEKAKEFADRNTNLGRNNSYIDSYHYIDKKEVAKLHSSISGEAVSDDAIYSACTQAIHPIIYSSEGYDEDADEILEFAIIVCNNFNYFYKRDEGNSEGYSEIKENFLLEMNYSFLDSQRKVANGYFLIDIVDFNQIDSFINEINAKDVINAFGANKND